MEESSKVMYSTLLSSLKGSLTITDLCAQMDTFNELEKESVKTSTMLLNLFKTLRSVVRNSMNLLRDNLVCIEKIEVS